MTNDTSTNTAAHQAAPAATKKPRTGKKTSAKKGAPKGRKTATTKKAPKPAAKKTAKANATDSIPREFSKRAILVEAIQRPEGASLDELMKLVGWAAHSVRGALSVLKSKSGIPVERITRQDGSYAYHAAVK